MKTCWLCSHYLELLLLLPVDFCWSCCVMWFVHKPFHYFCHHHHNSLPVLSDRTLVLSYLPLPPKLPLGCLYCLAHLCILLQNGLFGCNSVRLHFLSSSVDAAHPGYHAPEQMQCQWQSIVLFNAWACTNACKHWEMLPHCWHWHGNCQCLWQSHSQAMS